MAQTINTEMTPDCTPVKELEVMTWERNPLPPDDAELSRLDKALSQTPEDPELHKRRGLRLARLGYYREAAECFSRAIAIAPFHWEYYRHRAHRFISCGLFFDAAADFTIASRLNPDDWNVWYHLGLAWFLLGDYEKADAAYLRCEAVSKTADDLVAVSDWHYLTLRRLGREKDAEKILRKITPDLPVTDEVSGSYFRRLLLYKGLIGPEELFKPEDRENGAALSVITQGFGLANYWLFRGDNEKYEELLDLTVRIAVNSPWYSAFACLAARVDKQRLEQKRSEA